MLPIDQFRDWQENTNSIFWAARKSCASNGSLVLTLSRNSRYAAGASMIFNPKLAAFRLRELICRQRCCAS
jgi:hypothetical protein